uniref:BRCT domain-containing protein n=1 Tax=Trypanosoma congolense (strain IL3000) TaxID=1068625 RepID=G0UZ33_TRYCI|nr:conserved hypothetical protein [Trypanosoma congolense IL3000]
MPNKLWVGVRFFVCADVLVSFDAVDANELEGRPGCPQQRSITVDGEPLPITSYPAASLFLETLKRTGGSLAIVAPWTQEKTSKVLRLFGWEDVDEVRIVHPEPGRGKLHLSCFGCPTEDYGTSVVVTTSRAEWYPSLWPQIVEVNHGSVSVPYSLALLRALSACLRIAEWRVRLPHASVSSCATLCRSRLLSRYLFFLDPEVAENCTVALLINEHGGCIVQDAEHATHYVTLDQSLNSPHTFVGQSRVQCGVNTEEGLFSLSKSVVESTVLPMAHNGRSYNTTEADDEIGVKEEDEKEVSGTVTGNSTGLVMREEEDYKACGERNEITAASICRTMHDTCEENNTGCGAVKEKANEHGTAIAVTVQWLNDCAEGLFLYPSHVSHASEDDSYLNTTGFLLAAIVPPSDADPLTLSSFNRFSEQKGFQPIEPALNSTEADLVATMMEHWSGSLRVELRGSEVFLSQPNVYTDTSDDETDKHLAFLANHFCEVWMHAVRRRSLLHLKTAGTQTTIAVTVTHGTNTEAEPCPAASMVPPQAPSLGSASSAPADGPSKEQPPVELPFLMRALGPADWAKELDGSRSTNAKDQPPVATEADDGIPQFNPAPPKESPLAMEEQQESGEVFSDEQKDSAKRPALNVDDILADGLKPGHVFEKCFIPTEAIVSERDSLDRTTLERQPPFRNYPLKLNVSKSGIFCKFPTTADAKRFLQEGHVELFNQVLPIRPIFETRNESGVVVERKRRRSPSPVAVGQTFPARWSGQNTSVLTTEEMKLLGALNITYQYALENVPLLERYAYNELSNKSFRKERGILLRIISKLKGPR